MEIVLALDTDMGRVTLVGTFQDEMDLFRHLVRTMFGDDSDVLLQYAIGLADVPHGAPLSDWAWETVSDWGHDQQFAQSMLYSRRDGKDYKLKFADTGDRNVDFFNDLDTFDTDMHDKFGHLSSTLTPEQHHAIRQWIVDDTMMEHVNLLVWVQFMRDRNGFCDITRLVAGFLFTT